jgi:hypothetical protein
MSLNYFPHETFFIHNCTENQNTFYFKKHFPENLAVFWNKVKEYGWARETTMQYGAKKCYFVDGWLKQVCRHTASTWLLKCGFVRQNTTLYFTVLYYFVLCSYMFRPSSGYLGDGVLILFTFYLYLHYTTQYTNIKTASTLNSYYSSTAKMITWTAVVLRHIFISSLVLSIIL